MRPSVGLSVGTAVLLLGLCLHSLPTTLSFSFRPALPANLQEQSLIRPRNGRLTAASVDSPQSQSHETTADEQQAGEAPQQSSEQQQEETEEYRDETYQTNLKIAELARQCAQEGTVRAAVEAYQLLRNNPDADTVAYNTVLHALAKVSPARIDQKTTAAQKADSLLQEMKQLHAVQVAANRHWYEALTRNELNDAQISAGPPTVRVKPNVRSWSTVMDAYGRTGALPAAERVEVLLQDLQEAHEKADYDVALRPNLITFNTVLKAWAKSGCGGAAVDQCLVILQTMQDSNPVLEPDVISYNAVLHAMARSGRPNAGQQAQDLLDTMIQIGVQPNGQSYTTCMDAWGQCGQPDRAWKLLQDLIAEYRQTGDASLAPNCISYSTVIHAYAISKDAEKAKKALTVFSQMKRVDGVAPNHFTYNSLLNCCATSTTTHPELLKMVQVLYRQVLEMRKADHFTFGTVLKACGNLVVWTDDVQDFCAQVFDQARRQGQVSDGVLRQLRQAVSVDVYRSLVGTDQVHGAALPPDWSRNVRDRRPRRMRY